MPAFKVVTLFLAVAFLATTPAAALRPQLDKSGLEASLSKAPLQGWDAQVEAVLAEVLRGKGGMIHRVGTHSDLGDVDLTLRFFDELLAFGVPPEKILVVHEGGAPSRAALSKMLSQAPEISARLAQVKEIPLGDDLFERIRAHYGQGNLQVPIPLEVMFPAQEQREAMALMHERLTPVYEQKFYTEPVVFTTDLMKGLKQRGIASNAFERQPLVSWLFRDPIHSCHMEAIYALYREGSERAYFDRLRDFFDLTGWVTFLERDVAHAAYLETLSRMELYRDFLIVDIRAASHERITDFVRYGEKPHAVSRAISHGEVDPDSEFLDSRIREGRLGTAFTEAERKHLRKHAIAQYLVAFHHRYLQQSKSGNFHSVLKAIREIVMAAPDDQVERINQLIYRIPSRRDMKWFADLPSVKQDPRLLERAWEYFIYAGLNELNPSPVSQQSREVFPAVVRTMTTDNCAEVFRSQITGGQFAGLEADVIPMDSDRVSGKLIFIMPDMAGPDLFESLRIFRGPPGTHLPLVFFARDDSHLREIQAGLEEVDLTAREIVNVQNEIQTHPGWSLFDVVADRQAGYSRMGVDVHTVWFPQDLRNLGRFLKISPVHLRTWQRALDRQYGTQA